jgi:hypothetical protein
MLSWDLRRPNGAPGRLGLFLQTGERGSAPPTGPGSGARPRQPIWAFFISQNVLVVLIEIHKTILKSFPLKGRLPLFSPKFSLYIFWQF